MMLRRRTASAVFISTRYLRIVRDRFGWAAISFWTGLTVFTKLSLWVWLSRLWRDWRSALAIVKPETVVAWHRAGYRRFWTGKVRHGQSGRPALSHEIRVLIRQMCRENPGWGAPRIHGELLKLGFDLGESSVSKYMV